VGRIVLDASALLAALNGEPGADKLTLELLSTAVISTVNLSEVQTKLINRGLSPDSAWAAALVPVERAIPFTLEQAKAAGSMVAETRAWGLSLGDRACLALGLELQAPVYTADRSWKNLKLGVQIHVIR